MGKTLAFVLFCALASSDASSQAIVQQAYLKAGNTEIEDRFGWSAAVSGDTVVVGATNEDSGATGVNGNPGSNAALGSGAAYVFVRSGATWSQQAYLKASNTGAGDLFGTDVAISGDTIVVAAYEEDSTATGVDGDETNNGAPASGAAYVFVRNGTTWSQQAYLKASNAEASDWFGRSVAVSGDTIVVGAPREASAAAGVDGDQADNAAPSSGAAYVFVRSGTSWSQQAYLKASNTEAFESFGTDVAVSGDTIVVGAVFEDSAATGVDGDQADGGAPNSGAAYVFVRTGGSWSQQAYLKASNTGTSDTFASTVSISGDTIVVGSANEDSHATGVNGDGGDDSASGAGAAYVFVRSGKSWAQQAYLKASNTGIVDNFGASLDVSGDTIVVAAGLEDGNATGVNGDQGNNLAPNSGAVYVFTRTGSSWAQHAYLKASNTGSGDGFGFATSVSGDTVLVTAVSEDSSATGVDGNQADNGASLSGAAYVLELGLDAWTDLGSGLPGATGEPQLDGTGTLIAGSPGTLTLSNAAPGAPCTLFLSLTGTPSPFKCGTLVPVPVALQLALVTGGGGGISLAWPHWPGGLSGATVYFQYAIKDSAAVCGVALSNALSASVP